MKEAIRGVLGLARRLRFTLWRVQTALRLRWLGVALDADAGGLIRGPLPRVRLGGAQTAGSGSLRLRFGAEVRFEPGVAIDLKGGTDSELVLHDGVTVASNVRFVMRGGSVEVGRASHLHDGAIIKAAGRLVIGENYQLRYMAVIHCEEAVTLEGDGAIAERVTVVDLEHPWDGTDKEWHRHPVVTAPVHVGRNTMIYANSVVKRGVTIGANSVVAAGSVVRSGEYPPGSLLAGAPAKLVRTGPESKVKDPARVAPVVGILCGGKGTRMAGGGPPTPKPLVEVGGRPILWHVMSLYAGQGLSRFVLLLGHGREEIEAFAATLPSEWEVACVDTGLDTPTGGRVARAREHFAAGTFCLTYADGVADIDLGALVAFHGEHGRAATMTVVRPQNPWGVVHIADGERIDAFEEKPPLDCWVNGGFFVMEPRVLDAIGPDDVLERRPLATLARSGELFAYRHSGFWDCMDTFKDTLLLNELWESGTAPWRMLVEA